MGLKRAWDLGIRQLILSNDYLEACKLISDACNENHHYCSKIKEIRSMLRHDSQVEVRHISRNLNLEVDHGESACYLPCGSVASRSVAPSLLRPMNVVNISGMSRSENPLAKAHIASFAKSCPRSR